MDTISSFNIILRPEFESSEMREYSFFFIIT